MKQQVGGQQTSYSGQTLNQMPSEPCQAERCKICQSRQKKIACDTGNVGSVMAGWLRLGDKSYATPRGPRSIVAPANGRPARKTGSSLIGHHS